MTRTGRAIHLVPSRAIALAFTATVGCALLLLAVAHPAQAFPGKNGRIAFFREAGQFMNDDIVSIKPQGTGDLNLTRSGHAEDTDPAYSANGKRITFSSRQMAPIGRSSRCAPTGATCGS